MKKAYYYLFYKFYKLAETAPSRWLSDWKAGIVIITLEVWLLLSIGVYYATLTKTKIELNIRMPIVFIPLLVILVTNYLMFIHSDVWKEYIEEFDKLPKKKNRYGTLIVLAVVIFVVANLIFSFYLMSQIDWTNYN